jgi:hypothetical protein
MTIWHYCAAAFLIGTSVGLSELLSRYSWTFRDIIMLSAGLTYLGLNGGVAVVAYLAAVQWNLLSVLHDKNELWRVLAISLLAMAALRSAFANIRIGGKEVAAGLASFIEIFLRRAERELDQKLGLGRLEAIADALEGLTYAATKDYFLAMTEGVMRSLTKPDVEGLQNDVSKIDALEVDDATKMALLGMRIVERTDLSLFVSLAQRAKVQLASANRLATERASDRIQRLAAARNLLH